MTITRTGLALGLAALAAGCAQIQVNRESASWALGQQAVRAGMSEDRLRSCAGEPMRKVQTADDVTWVYGVSKYMSFASAYCVLSISVRDGRTTGFTRRSGNPGGFGDYPQVCAYILDRCVGEGRLMDTSGSFGESVVPMQSEQDVGTTVAQGNAAVAQGLSLMAGLGAPARAPVPSFVPPPTLPTPLTPLTPSAPSTLASAGGERLSRPMTDCVQVTQHDVMLPTGIRWTLANRCGVRINVFHCFDDAPGLGGACNRRMPPTDGSEIGEWWGGSLGTGTLAPGRSTTSVYVWPGKYLHVRACEFPDGVVDVVDTSVGDGGQYVCEIR